MPHEDNSLAFAERAGGRRKDKPARGYARPPAPKFGYTRDDGDDDMTQVETRDRHQFPGFLEKVRYHAGMSSHDAEYIYDELARLEKIEGWLSGNGLRWYACQL